MGVAYGGLGDIDRAVAWYQKGMEERAPNDLCEGRRNVGSGADRSALSSPAASDELPRIVGFRQNASRADDSGRQRAAPR